VAGRYRTGKSFLMNQLAGDAAASTSFSVGHTVESNTKGIWLCGEAVKARTAAGDEIDMLLMDSEGLGATDKVRVGAVPASDDVGSWGGATRPR
jgi:hypothetical protein